MRAETQELIERNIARIAVEGGNLTAEVWAALDAKQQRRYVTLWRRIEREAAKDAVERAYMNSDGPAHTLLSL